MRILRHRPANAILTNCFRMCVITDRPAYMLCDISVIKMRAFWDIAPCNLVGVDRRFRGTYYIHHKFNETYHSIHNYLCLYTTISYGYKFRSLYLRYQYLITLCI
jgi:hypothetical protein